MEQGVKRTQRDYTLTFKLAVVSQVEKQTPDAVHQASNRQWLNSPQQAQKVST